MLNENDQTRIERYLKRQLKGKELDDFTNRLKTNAEFAQEVALQKDMYEGIKLYALEKEKALLNEFDEQYQKIGVKTSLSKRVFQKKYFVAASISILLASSLLIFTIHNSQGIDSEKLYIENFIPASSPKVGYQKSTNQPENLEMAAVKAFEHYSNEQYQEAAEYFEYNLNIIPEDVISLYYLGNCYLMEDKVSKAISTFQQIINKEENVYTDESFWYLALANLKKNDLTKARNYLKKVIANTSDEALEEKAEELLGELE